MPYYGENDDPNAWADPYGFNSYGTDPNQDIPGQTVGGVSQDGSLGVSTAPRMADPNMAGGGGNWWDTNGYAGNAMPQMPMAPQPMSQGGYPLAPQGLGADPNAPLLAPWTTPFKYDPSQMENDPSYQFQRDEGLKGVERSAAARGTLLTGGTAKALERYGQGLASSFDDKYWARQNQDYDRSHNLFRENQTQPFNMLSALAGTGQTAASQLNSAGSSYAGQAGDLTTGAGNAGAASRIAQGNAWGGAVNNAGNDALLWYLMNKQGQ